MPNYQDGKIYTIRCRNDNTLIYVGSTTQPLAKRWGDHKNSSKCIKYQNRLIYITINNNWDNWYIELYEEYPCENKEQLHKREGEIIREIGTLNIRIEGRRREEYYETNKEQITDKHKIYYENNKDKLLDYHKTYYQNNKDKYKEYYNNKKTLKHIQLLENI